MATSGRREQQVRLSNEQIESLVEIEHTDAGVTWRLPVDIREELELRKAEGATSPEELHGPVLAVTVPPKGSRGHVVNHHADGHKTYE